MIEAKLRIESLKYGELYDACHKNRREIGSLWGMNCDPAYPKSLLAIKRISARWVFMIVLSLSQ